MPDVDINQDNGKNLWSNLLQEVKEKSSKTCNLPISLIVLGNEGSGKSSLIARLQKLDVKHGVGLEFDYIEIKDESTDENKKLNVWISSGDTYHTNLLKYALNETNFGYSCCMIIVSFSEPWNLIDSLEEWLRNLKMHIDRLKIKHQDVQFYKDTLTRQFQEYSEPDLEIEKQIVGKRRDTDFNYLHPSVSEDPDKVLVPLEDGVFVNNLGLPIIVVITKTDSIFTLEQNFDYNDDKFDFIQMHLRKICLKYGAALCYTSLKDDRNCDLLLNYLLHRCYGFPMINNASVIEKDAIFIPAGWDNIKKINILSENLMDDIRKQSYSSLINKPLSLVRANAQNRLTEPEVAEDEQVFLMKQQALIQRIKASGSTDGNIKDISRGGSSVTSSSSNRSRKNVPGLTSSTGNTSNTGAQQANEGVLANFFSSLLNKRGVSAGSPLPNQPSVGGDLSRCDSAISELDDSQRDEVISNSSTSNADWIQSKPKEASEILNPGKIIATANVNKFNNVGETKNELDHENSEQKLVLKTFTDLNTSLDDTNVNDISHKYNNRDSNNEISKDKQEDKQVKSSENNNTELEILDENNSESYNLASNVKNSEIERTSTNLQDDLTNYIKVDPQEVIENIEETINSNVKIISENDKIQSDIHENENTETGLGNFECVQDSMSVDIKYKTENGIENSHLERPTNITDQQEDVENSTDAQVHEEMTEKIIDANMEEIVDKIENESFFDGKENTETGLVNLVCVQDSMSVDIEYKTDLKENDNENSHLERPINITDQQEDMENSTDTQVHDEMNEEIIDTNVEEIVYKTENESYFDGKENTEDKPDEEKLDIDLNDDVINPKNLNENENSNLETRLDDGVCSVTEEFTNNLDERQNFNNEDTDSQVDIIKHEEINLTNNIESQTKIENECDDSLKPDFLLEESNPELLDESNENYDKLNLEKISENLSKDDIDLSTQNSESDIKENLEESSSDNIVVSENHYDVDNEFEKSTILNEVDKDVLVEDNALVIDESKIINECGQFP